MELTGGSDEDGFVDQGVYMHVCVCDVCAYVCTYVHLCMHVCMYVRMCVHL